MKNVLKILIAFVLLGSFTSYGQETKLDNLVNKMFTDVINRDFESILNMTHPKVYEILPKEQMLSVLKSMFEGNEEFSIELSDEIPEYVISDVFKGTQNNLEYAFVSYDMDMKMTFNNQEFDEEAKKMMIPMMKAQGMDVEFVSANAMNVSMKDRVTILLKEDVTDNKWVMVNYDPNSPLFYQVVSSELLEKAKQYQQDLLLESKKQQD